MPFDPSKPCNRPMSTKAGVGFVLRLIARGTANDIPAPSASQFPWLTLEPSPVPLVHACPWRPQRG